MMIKDRLIEILEYQDLVTAVRGLRCERCKHSVRYSEVAEYLGCERVPVSRPDDEGTELAEVTSWNNFGTQLVVKPDFFCALWEAK